MPEENGIWFVRRSPHDGPWSKRIRRLQAPSILTWFQWRIDEARIARRPTEVAVDELGGVINGLSKLFQSVQDKVLRSPRSMTALRKMLCETWWDDINAQEAKLRVQADGQTLRVLSQGGSIVFVQDQAAAAHPEQFAFLLRDDPALPVAESSEAFAHPFDVPVAHATEGTLSGGSYVCVLAGNSDSPGQVFRLQGVDVAGLPALLRSEWTGFDQGPQELRSLCGKFRAGETSLEVALRSMARDAVDDGNGEPEIIVSVTAHTAVLCARTSRGVGFRQVVVFDDAWAGAHPELATSLLRYALSWDPCARLRGASAVQPKRQERKPSPPRKPRPTKAARRAAEEQTADWRTRLAGRTHGEAKPYNPRTRFEQGNLILHSKFGLGAVTRAEANKCEVTFEHATRVLVHGNG